MTGFSHVLAECRQLSELVTKRDYKSAVPVAVALWQEFNVSHPYGADEEQALLKALPIVADVHRYRMRDLCTALDILKVLQAWEPAERNGRDTSPSTKEWAAFQLALEYTSKCCYCNATHWIREALDAFQTRTGVEPLAPIGAVERDLSRQDVGRLEASLVYLVNSLFFGTDMGKDAMRLSRQLSALMQRSLTWERARLIRIPALAEMRYGDPSEGERLLRIMLSFTPPTLEAGSEQTQIRYALGQFLIDQGRTVDAQHLAQEGLRAIRHLPSRANRNARSRSLGTGESGMEEQYRSSLKSLMIGISVAADISTGHMQTALRKLVPLVDVVLCREHPERVPHQNRLTQLHQIPLEVHSLLLDRARLHAHFGDVYPAMACYAIYIYHLGELMANARVAPTNELRLYWVQRQEDAVHEMVSFWISLPEGHLKSIHERLVATTLLQLKANTQAALSGHRVAIYRSRPSVFGQMWEASRNYALAARRFADSLEDTELRMNVEDAYIRKDNAERKIVAGTFESNSAMASEFVADFCNLQMFWRGEVLLDYHLLPYCPPQGGRKGHSGTLLYIGTRVERGKYTIVPLGSANEIDDVCHRYLGTLDVTMGDTYMSPAFQKLAELAHERLVKPMGHLPRRAYLSTDGLLARMPFHAFMCNGEFLAESSSLTYCHSPLRADSMSRQKTSIRRPSFIAKGSIVLGVSDYSGTGLPDLPGAGKEAVMVAGILGRHGESCQPLLNGEAISEVFVDRPHPRTVHIAAHGLVADDDRQMLGKRKVGEPYWPDPIGEYHVGPLLGLDSAMLHSCVVLGAGSDGVCDLHDRMLGAMEMSSLNLYGCEIAVMSACDTSIGLANSGAGSLGMQFALMASSCDNALLSLWPISDDATLAWMRHFYAGYGGGEHPTSAYFNTLKALCRSAGRPSHPGTWGAFILLG